MRLTLLACVLVSRVRDGWTQSENCCTQCKKNYIYTGGSYKSVNCYGSPCATYCVSNYIYCQSCAAGQYRRWNYCEECVTCPAGKYSINTNECANCEPGYFCQDGIRYGCYEGTYTASSGQSICEYCVNGKYAVGTPGTGCTTCESGYRCYNGVRYACDPGTFRTETGYDFCYYCDINTFQPNPGQPRCNSCTTCPTGYMVSKSSCSVYGSTVDRECTICPAGSYSASSNAASCTSCPDGTYQNNAGQSTCKTFTVCQPGQTTTTVGDRTKDYVCSTCTSPWTTRLGSQTSCSDCVAGKYKLGSTTCTDCNCVSQGEVYINCPVGSTAKGCNFCTGTQSGSYCEIGKQPSEVCNGMQTQDVQCVPCPAGKYKSVANSRSCVDCLTGFYKLPPASTASCTACSNKPSNAVYLPWTRLDGTKTEPSTSDCPW